MQAHSRGSSKPIAFIYRFSHLPLGTMNPGCFSWSAKTCGTRPRLLLKGSLLALSFLSLVFALLLVLQRITIPCIDAHPVCINHIMYRCASRLWSHADGLSRESRQTLLSINQ